VKETLSRLVFQVAIIRAPADNSITDVTRCLVVPIEGQCLPGATPCESHRCARLPSSLMRTITRNRPSTVTTSAHRGRIMTAA